MSYNNATLEVCLGESPTLLAVDIKMHLENTPGQEQYNGIKKN